MGNQNSQLITLDYQDKLSSMCMYTLSLTIFSKYALGNNINTPLTYSISASINPNTRELHLDISHYKFRATRFSISNYTLTILLACKMSSSYGIRKINFLFIVLLVLIPKHCLDVLITCHDKIIMSKITGEVLILYHHWAKIKLTLQYNTTYFIMILNHSKFTINVGQMIKLYWLNKRTKKCEDIIPNHCWAEIELILMKT
jgi:hypothetical protein